MKMKSVIVVAVVLGLLIPASVRAGDTIEVGSQLPKLRVTWVRNKPKDIEGKVLIVEFWATWCPPCRKSIPHLKELQEKYGEKGLVIMGLTSEARGTIVKFAKKNDMTYAVGLDKKGRLAKDFGVRGIPSAALVDRSGKVVWKGHPMRLDESQIEELLAQKVEAKDKKTKSKWKTKK
ncbi:MAG: TlpA family protein disulfide reductase [Lentisphaeria bacterium]|nr:TlpA family protein disulfide reductase [Lentisphaeria bacterium]